MVRSIYLYLAFALILFCTISFTQEKKESGEQRQEMKPSTVKELDDFHTLLHPLVHDAYPNKDFASIKKALPGLIESATTLKNASLPKELSAKKNSFKKEAKKLLKQLTDLKKKQESLADETFGKKFMEMHDTFEKMMDMTR
jgi:hypothetical protein